MADNSWRESRARHACEPCRKKKTKCPGEKPICSFCRRLNQRCTYMRRGEDSRLRKSQSESREHLHRLESQMERMNDVIQTLTEQRAPSSTTTGLWMSETSRESTSHSQLADSEHSGQIELRFQPSTCPHPSPEDLAHFVEIYRTKLDCQPLPLFNIDSLSIEAAYLPQFLLRSFLAITVVFTEHRFYGSSKAEAIEFYTRTAREAVIHLATEGHISLHVLQALCLLTLGDLAAGKQSRAWMTIGIACRLAVALQCCGTSTAISGSPEDKARCYWSVFILERALRSGHSNMLQNDLVTPPHFHYPPSPPTPSTLVDQHPSVLSVKDLGVNTYCIQAISHWSDVTIFIHQARLGKVEDPWETSSTYTKLLGKIYQLETHISQAHRLRNVGFQDVSPEAYRQNKSYWACWLQLQMAFHASHALLHHPLIHLMNFRNSAAKAPPPSFLQHAVDQALLHSGWIVRLILICERQSLQVDDPLVGRLVAMAATIHWIFQFASDETAADKSRGDFETCHRFLTTLAQTWPQFSSTTNTLDYLQSLTATRKNGLPPLKTSLLWGILDSCPCSLNGDDSRALPPAATAQHIQTQHLTPLREPSNPRPETPTPTPIPSYDLLSDLLLPGSLTDNGFFNIIDMPTFPQFSSDPSFNFHGGL
ncbi:hypothetical protein FE257_003981 [Aspergillus nanangensis]|uniref:Zn(2)-C6 fungal-type domain-containing protein n=1 Tax=Aspergillus nanangensis TaxID=2582783 RepID=A0AAD4CRS1_ASPNN|nr:hypothetical protein FE257_003981 [Aspergillus nanangensis]